MKSFLKEVASDIVKKYGSDLSKLTVVFPNKRASLFMNEYLYEEVGHSLWSPRYVTISELMKRNSRLKLVDRIEAVMTLYECYQQVVSEAESIDRFWSWGEMILADFDDLDKNLGDAENIFCNVKDLHALDSLDYLTDVQRQALKDFFFQFKDDQDSRLKERFLKLWNNLYPLYRLYNKTLKDRGLAYEGALYRQVAEDAEALKEVESIHLFVGFNMVQKSEQHIFKLLMKHGKAKFYWDFDYYYIDNKRQEAGKFIREYLGMFPNELPSDSEVYKQFSQPKDLQILSAPTEDIQARYIKQWLREKGRMDEGEKTAIVLCDEKLLTRVIHSLPEELQGGKVNITLGFPLSQTPVTALVKSFLAMHIHGFNRSSANYVLKFVAPLLRDPLITRVTPVAGEILETLHREHISYPLASDLCKDEMTELLFKTPETTLNQQLNAPQAHETSITLLLERLLAILGRLKSEDPLEQESIYRMSNLVNRMKEGAMEVSGTTFMRLMDQVIQGTTMPFHGEPARGIQIMGVLETRNLDFDHVLMLSCNEGKLPKGVNDSSLIPYSVRSAHQLTTIDNKVAVYAYYFYRLMQRCNDVSVAWNCSTEGVGTGQMSRFLLQLMVEATNIKIEKCALTASSFETVTTSQKLPVEKSDEVMEKLMALEKLSPTALNKYLRCRKQFYYNIVEGLKEENPDDIADKRIFGIVFHKAAELLYKTLRDGRGLVTKQAIETLMKEKKHETIYRRIDEAFTEELFSGRKRQYDGLQLINREVIMTFLLKLLEKDKQLAPFYHLDDELYVKEMVKVENTEKVVQIGGYIDRLDRRLSKEGDTLMVIDYKTGSTLPGQMESLEDVFKPENVGHHSDYYLQTFLYSVILASQKKEAVSPALLFVQKKESVENPVLKIGGRDVTDIREYEKEFRERLSKLLSEIFDSTVAFTPTEDPKHCNTCPYREICNG